MSSVMQHNKITIEMASRDKQRHRRARIHPDSATDDVETPHRYRPGTVALREVRRKVAVEDVVSEEVDVALEDDDSDNSVLKR